MATSSRMLLLLSLLQARRDWPGAVLAERLDISARTVRRDVDRLRELGYHIRAIKGPDGGYRLDAGSELPPLLFDDDQAVVLAVALQSLTAPGLEEPAARALAAVRQVMPARLRARIDIVQVAAVPVVSDEIDPAVLVTIGAAIQARETLRFDYNAVLRQVEPHNLVTSSGRWYLLGWDADRADWRTFRVDRLVPRTHTGARFTPRAIPGGSASAFVSARFKGSDVADSWPCIGSVTLRMPAAAAAPYVGDGSVEDLGSVGCRVTLGAWSWVGVAASIARFDAEISHVSPAELAEAFTILATRFASATARV